MSEGVSPPRVHVSLDATAVPAHPAGAGRYVLDLAAALARQPALELDVISRRDDTARWHGDTVSARTRVVNAAPTLRPLRLAWEQVRLPGLLSDLGIDVHHAPHYTMPARARIPTVVTIHDLSFLESPSWHQPVKVAFFRTAIRFATTHADALIAVSAATASRLDKLLSPKIPVHVIPHGVDTARLHPLDSSDGEAVEDDRSARAALGVTDPYVLFVGTIEPRKDVPTLVRAFDRVAHKWPDLTLVLAGAMGWGNEPVREAISTAAHGKRIRRLGYVSEDSKAALLRGAAVVAYPSLEEGFGLPALEALACGVPLVTTTGSSMEEVVGSAALLVAPGDKFALGDAIDAVLSGASVFEARRELGLQIAARHTWEASAAAHAAVYRAVL